MCYCKLSLQTLSSVRVPAMLVCLFPYLVITLLRWTVCPCYNADLQDWLTIVCRVAGADRGGAWRQLPGRPAHTHHQTPEARTLRQPQTGTGSQGHGQAGVDIGGLAPPWVHCLSAYSNKLKKPTPFAVGGLRHWITIAYNNYFNIVNTFILLIHVFLQGGISARDTSGYTALHYSSLNNHKVKWQGQEMIKVKRDGVSFTHFSFLIFRSFFFSQMQIFVWICKKKIYIVGKDNFFRVQF